jgi:hypothetical protein
MASSGGVFDGSEEFVHVDPAFWLIEAIPAPALSAPTAKQIDVDGHSTALKLPYPG